MANVIRFLDTQNSFLPTSGVFDFSSASMKIPSGSTTPAIQARNIDDTLTTLDSQLIYISENSGVLMVASGNNSWVGRVVSFPSGKLPNEISNLLTWVRGEDHVVTGVSGVQTWNDKSVNGNDFSGDADSAGSDFPFIASGNDGINGKDAMYLDGIAGQKPYFILTDASFNGNDTPITIIMAYEQGPAAGSSDGEFALVGLGNTANLTPYMEWGIRYSSDAWQFNRRDDAGLNITSDDGAPANTAGKQAIASFVFSGGVYHGYINGHEITPSSGILADVGTYGHNRIAIGALIRTSKIHFYKGKIGEVAIYTSGLNDVDRRDVQSYMSDYWGIALSGAD